MGIYKKGKNYYIDYYVNGKRRREKIGPSKSLAELVLKKRLIEIAEGKFLDIRKEEKVTFDEGAERFIEVYAKINKKSWRGDLLRIKYLKRTFGGKYLSGISSFHVENYKRQRIIKAKPATVNRELACLKTIFNKAIEWGLTKTNPVRQVRLFKENNQRVRYLSDEEMRTLLNNASEPLKSIILVALHTGLRQGEIVNLKWANIDFNLKTIYLKDTKTGEKRIPINETVYNLLCFLKANNEVRKDSSDSVFPMTKGYRVSHRFAELTSRLGIKDFRFHDLRHSFASYLVMMNVNLKTIQELLGHKSYLMTLRYAHLSGDYKKEVVDKLGQRMDTIWSPEPIPTDEPNMLKSLKVNQGNLLAILSRDGGTADAKDLKSFEE